MTTTTIIITIGLGLIIALLAALVAVLNHALQKRLGYLQTVGAELQAGLQNQLKVSQLDEMLRRQMRENREELNRGLLELRLELQDTLHKNLLTGGELQKQKFEEMARQQERLITGTEKRLDEMRLMVEEKLQKTLNERIGQSFELVRAQLESVQQGLGEMKTLAQDVGGLKKVLTGVKTRGVLGEVQLAALLEQMLSPEQYTANVRTKQHSSDFVEFAIKLPGQASADGEVYLPIDAKFPADAYEQYVEAFESGDAAQAESCGRQLEATLRRMGRDIHDKYLDPPYTTDFAILFLPFENIYAEVLRRTVLVETLQRECKVIVTGPTTLGAILNSLQMGFRTLAIQKRSSEVWNILGAVKTEFGKFGGLLEKVQKSLQAADKDLEQMIGTRSRAIERKLRQVQELPASDSRDLLPPEDE